MEVIYFAASVEQLNSNIQVFQVHLFLYYHYQILLSAHVADLEVKKPQKEDSLFRRTFVSVLKKPF